MDRLEELKNKYKNALDAVKQKGVVLSHLHVQDNKLVMQGSAPTQDAVNEVWNQVKAADPSYSDTSIQLTVDPSLAPAQPQASAAFATGGSAKTYTVQSGDSLSKIAKQFYGDANSYNKIFEANRDKLSDPSKIQPGQVLNIP